MNDFHIEHATNIVCQTADYSLLARKHLSSDRRKLFECGASEILVVSQLRRNLGVFEVKIRFLRTLFFQKSSSKPQILFKFWRDFLSISTVKMYIGCSFGKNVYFWFNNQPQGEQ